MRIAVWNDAGDLVATSDGNNLNMFRPAEQDLLGYALFKLFLKMVSRGGGASYGGPLADPVTEVTEVQPADFDMGAP